ncbi:hypothetical protein KCU86_g24, partial [Aureobasidium melanogenum]
LVRSSVVLLSLSLTGCVNWSAGILMAPSDLSSRRRGCFFAFASLRSRDPYISFALAISCCEISSVALLASSCAAFWVALVSRRRLFSNTALIVLSGLVPSSLISPFQPDLSAKLPDRRAWPETCVSLAVSEAGTLTGTLIVTSGDFEGVVARGIDAGKATAAVRGRAAPRGAGVGVTGARGEDIRSWRSGLFGYLLVSSFESLEERNLDLRRSDGRRDFSLMRCTVLSFRPLTVAIMQHLPSPLDTLLPYLPWRAQFPDSRSAFEWRYHFLSLALCISVCQSLSLILQVLLQLSELSFQILVSLFSSRIFGGSWDNPAEVAQPLIDFTDDCSDSSFLSFRERLNVLSIRVFGNLGRSLDLLSDCADTGFAAAFAVLSSSSRRRMACFGVDIRLWKLEFGLGIGLLLLEFLILLQQVLNTRDAGDKDRSVSGEPYFVRIIDILHSLGGVWVFVVIGVMLATCLMIRLLYL